MEEGRKEGRKQGGRESEMLFADAGLGIDVKPMHATHSRPCSTGPVLTSRYSRIRGLRLQRPLLFRFLDHRLLLRESVVGVL